MSGIILLAYWIVLPLLSIIIAILLLKHAKRPIFKWLVRALCTGWFAWLLWFLVGGEKILLDMQVDKLCAEDGGIKVYETVTLPAEMFDKWGVFYVPPKKKVKPEDEYYYIRETQYFQKGNPVMWKSTHKIYRKFDGKLLGESIRYARQGGDLPGPWHESSYGCPKICKENPQLENLIFIKEE